MTTRSVLLAACFLSAHAWAAPPVLTVGKISGQAGAVVDLPVSVDSGTASIWGAQFNLTLPPGASLTTVVPSSSLTAAGKTVSSHSRGNIWTFVIFGLNQNANLGGVLFTAKVKLAPGASAGAFDVAVSSPVYSDLKGQSIPAGSSVDGILTIR